MHQLRQLVINKSYSELVNPLTQDEYIELKNSIAENGQYIPIVINNESVILDGHHRFKACAELNITPKFVKKEFESNLYKELFVIDCNLKRRHLNAYQKGVILLKKKIIMSKISKSNSLSNLKQNKLSTVKHLALGRVNHVIGREAGLSHETIRKISVIQDKASAKDITLLNSGQKTISKIYRKVMKEEKRREFMKIKPSIELPDGVKLMCGDFREKCKDIRSNSIDLLFSDLPYDRDGVTLYRDLAKVAKRVLVDGGCMVVYAGQYHLPQVMEAIQYEGLKWWWMFCSKLNHYHGLVHRRNIYSSWKPILFYVKGDKPKYSTDSIEDFISSPEPDKTLYRYQQSVEEAEYIIKHLTVENHSIILDCLMGSGTSGVAALKLGRKFIGIEKDKSVFALAKKRLSINKSIS